MPVRQIKQRMGGLYEAPSRATFWPIQRAAPLKGGFHGASPCGPCSERCSHCDMSEREVAKDQKRRRRGLERREVVLDTLCNISTDREQRDVLSCCFNRSITPNAIEGCILLRRRLHGMSTRAAEPCSRAERRAAVLAEPLRPWHGAILPWPAACPPRDARLPGISCSRVGANNAGLVGPCSEPGD
jgi:hypothetical protein